MTPTTLKAMVSDLRQQHKSYCTHSDDMDKDMGCICPAGGDNDTVDRILAAIEGHVLVPAELVDRAFVNVKPVLATIDIVTVPLRACLDASEEGKS